MSLVYVCRIVGEVPSKKNSKRLVRAGNGRVYLLPGSKHEKWHRMAALQAKCAFVSPRKPIDEPCRVEIVFTHGDRIKRDHNNQAAAVMDLLVDVGILADDNWLIVAEEAYSGKYDKGHGGAEIKIFSLKNH